MLTERRSIAIVLLALVLAVFVACGENGSGTASDCNTEEVETDEGLRYRDIECGDGAEAEKGDTLRVHYTAELEDGTEVDSSEGGPPLPFVLGGGNVIPGWDIGLEGMRVGGERRLTIPPELAYGAAGAPPDIPPNATLVFDVELVELSPAED